MGRSHPSRTDCRTRIPYVFILSDDRFEKIMTVALIIEAFFLSTGLGEGQTHLTSDHCKLGGLNDPRLLCSRGQRMTDRGRASSTYAVLVK